MANHHLSNAGCVSNIHFMNAVTAFCMASLLIFFLKDWYLVTEIYSAGVLCFYSATSEGKLDYQNKTSGPGKLSDAPKVACSSAITTFPGYRPFPQNYPHCSNVSTEEQ